MKKSAITLFTVFSSFLTLAQESGDTKQSELGIKVDAKLGYATLIQSDMVNTQGDINGGEVQFYYKLPGGTSFNTGIGLMDFRANGTLAGESYFLDQRYLRIPLYVNYSLSIFEKQFDDKLQGYAGIGLYANTLLREEIQTLGGTDKNKNQGWNGGYGFQLGMKFGVSDNFNFGLGFESQNDFSKMKKNGVERKLEQISTVNFTLEFKF